MTKPNISRGAMDILAERVRVLDCEPYDAAHDDQHADGQLAVVAAELITAHTGTVVMDPVIGHEILGMWGLRGKHHDTRRRLVIAGALVAAEIDRLDRLEAKKL